MNSIVDIFSTLDNKEAILDNIKSTLGYEELKKDPQGSCFYYLVPEGKDISPIAIAFLPELDNSNQDELSIELFDTKSELYKRIYGHFINRQFSEQPALYLLLPENNINGFAIITKPTDSGLRARSTSLYKLNERDFIVKLECLRKNSLQVLEGLFAKIPQVDFLFFNTINTAGDLAKELARITRELEQAIVTIYNKEQENGFLHQLHESFRKELLPLIQLESNDPKEYGFADLYAQTISYGMFSARFFKPDKNFERRAIADYIPPTNPFLKNLFTSITTEQESKEELYKELFDKIEDLVGTLASVNMNSVLKDFHFDDENQEDIVIHFYETFLSEYNPVQKEYRGVYYTPAPVVLYIVRSVDEILKNKFNKALGIADPNVIILDPAAGTGTFLFSIINEVHEYYEKNLKANGEKTWDDFVNENILPRIFGFELMMAPYAIAHLKLGLELQKYGYNFNTKQRLGVYLTNSLEQNIKKAESLFGEFISNESNEAAVIKNEKPVMLVIGNPPYSGISANGDLFSSEIDAYKYIEGTYFNERKHWLNDDYVKFIRYAQMFIDKNNEGILAYITNHAFLDNTTFRCMRYNLLKSFDEIYILDLHGNSKKNETCPDGSVDENVFNIQQGVSINIFVKTGVKNSNNLAKLYHKDIYGKENIKYNYLNNNLLNVEEYSELKYSAPHYFFIPKDFTNEELYNTGFNVNELFLTSSTGIVTMGDPFIICDDKEKLFERLKNFKEHDISVAEFKKAYGLGKNYAPWLIENKSKISLNKDCLTQITYRPFDNNWTYFDNTLVWRPRTEVMQNFVLGENLGLICNRVVKSVNYTHAFIVNKISDFHILETANANPNCFPLYIYKVDLFGFSRYSNLNLEIIKKISKNINIDFVEEDNKFDYKSFAPIHVLDYIYGVLHSNLYREQYNEFLKIDFPKIPYPKNANYFFQICHLGKQIRELHLLESPKVNDFITLYPIKGENKVEKFEYLDGKVYISNTQYFDRMPREAWELFIGSYQPAQKWLKDRKGKILSIDDINHYHKMIVSLYETSKLMDEIDEIIDLN